MSIWADCAVACPTCHAATTMRVASGVHGSRVPEVRAAVLARMFHRATCGGCGAVLAVDRTNQAISDLYLSYHPAILRSLKRIASAALAAGKPVSFCGEMASDPKILPFLLGIGIRRLSLEPRQIPRVYQQVTTLRVSDAHKEADHLLTLGRICDIEAALGIERPPHL